MSKDVVISGYESIKKGLLDSGFTQEGQTFTKINKHQNVMNVNGHQFTQEVTNTITIEYLGEGYVENQNDKETIYGFSIKQNKESVVDIWVQNIDEFRELCY